MTIAFTGVSKTGVSAYHYDEGFVLTIGALSVTLTEEQADDLGRYLLFDKVASPAAHEPTPTAPIDTHSEEDG